MDCGSLIREREQLRLDEAKFFDHVPAEHKEEVEVMYHAFRARMIRELEILGFDGEQQVGFIRLYAR